MVFTKGQLVAILNCSQATEDKWIDSINKTCEKYSINTILRLAGFIAQVGHESGGLKVVEENLNYSASGLQSIFGKYFDSATASSYARQPEKIANRVYASRMGNGAESTGEGWKYRGRGLIQCTGKSNYNDCAKSIGVNCVAQPELLVSPEYAAMSAGWFWNSRSLNDYADRKDVLGITKKINGGTNGLAERQSLYDRAIVVLSGGTPEDSSTNAKKADSVPAATTDSMENKKTPGAKNTAINEPSIMGGSEYPYNAVFQSRSGHITQVDDTPGKERLSTMHRTGSYWAIDQLGTYTHKSVLDSYKITKSDSYEYVGGNYTNQTKGQFFVNSDSDLILKSQSGIFMNTPRVQANTSMFAVSGELTANQVTTPLLKAQFSDTLAKEAMSAWSIKKGAGGAPILSNSMGFSGTPKTDELRSNDLAYKTPAGIVIITNGIPRPSNSGGSDNNETDNNGSSSNIQNGNGDGNAVSDMTQNAINGMGTTTPQLENCVKDAANDQLDKDVDSETPVFLRHVSFDKPTLLSQSTLEDAPDPSLYHNNLHTIVDPVTGKGKLHISDGTKWVPINSGSGGTGTSTGDIDGVIDQINKEIQDRIDAINAEADARVDAILELNDDLVAKLEEESAERQKVAQSVLDEATTRASAVIAEATARTKVAQDLSSEVLNRISAINDEALTRQTQINTEAINRAADIASTMGNVNTLISQEKTERTSDVAILAQQISTVGAKSDSNLAAIQTEQQARIAADSSMAQDIVSLTSSTNGSLAAINTQLSTLTTNTSATADRVSSLDTIIGNVSSSVVSESQARVLADAAMSQDIQSLTSTTNGSIAAINTQLNTLATDSSALASSVSQINVGIDSVNAAITSEMMARAQADLSLANRIDTIAVGFADNTALYQSEIKARADADAALLTKIDNIVATTDTDSILAAISNEQTARADADSALASDLEFLTSTTDIAVAAVKVLSTTQTIADSSLSEQIVELSANFDTSTADITERLRAMTLADEALATSITTLTTQVGSDIAAAILQESTARSTNELSLTRNIDTLTSQVGTNLATLQDEISTRTTQNDATVNRLNTLDTNVSGNLATISNEITARSTADDALGSRIDSMIARVGNSEAAIVTEAQVRSDAISSVASMVNVLSSQVSDAAASVATESIARSSETGALSSQISSLSSTVGTHTTSITTMSQSIDGVRANYSVKVDNNGYVSGFGLLSDPFNGIPISTFTILADKFALVKPGGSAIVPFSIDTTTTPTTINMNGNVKVNGTNISMGAIDTGHISYGAVTANQIAANTITAAEISTAYLYAGKISANQINAGSLSADYISGGTIRGVNLNISGNFVVNGTTGMSQLYTANLTRCTGSNGDASGIAAFSTTSAGTGAALQTNGGGGNAITITGGVNGIVQNGGGTNFLFTVSPNGDNSYDCGSPSNRWRNLYVASGVVSTSDARTKRDILETDLGLEFINKLRPVKYRMVVGHNEVTIIESTPTYDDPEPIPSSELTPVEGSRTHYGLIAQEVHDAMQDSGVDDAAFWIKEDPSNPDSLQGLRYEELLSPMIKAIQELSARVEAQNSIIKDLQNRLGAINA